MRCGKPECLTLNGRLDMHRRVTAGDDVQRGVTHVRVSGRDYVHAEEAARLAGVTRQTLWRWRRDQKVPAGWVYRDKQVLYTAEEVAAITQYAHRITPASNGRDSATRGGKPPGKDTGR